METMKKKQLLGDEGGGQFASEVNSKLLCFLLATLVTANFSVETKSNIKNVLFSSPTR